MLRRNNEGQVGTGEEVRIQGICLRKKGMETLREGPRMAKNGVWLPWTCDETEE